MGDTGLGHGSKQGNTFSGGLSTCLNLKYCDFQALRQKTPSGGLEKVLPWARPF